MMRTIVAILGWFVLTTVQAAPDVKTYIPPRAFDYLPTVYTEVEQFHPNPSSIGYFGSLIEHESCLSLTHSRCWSPTSELKTSRERGIGLGQLTAAYNADGSVRFDNVAILSKKYKTFLGELSWKNIKTRPDLQIRAMVLLWEESYRALYQVEDDYQRYAMSDSAYNGGLRDVNRARRNCGLAKSCNPQIWFDNVERHNPKSTRALYGQRSARDINNFHVRDVMITRRPKYERYFEETFNFKPRF